MRKMGSFVYFMVFTARVVVIKMLKKDSFFVLSADDNKNQSEFGPHI